MVDTTLIVDFAKFFLFPGAVFAVFMGLLVHWIDRKLYARMQNRVGPPLKQPIYDFLKLMAKTEVVPDGADKAETHLLPCFNLFVAILAALMVPLVALEGWMLISFTGDLMLFLFFLTLNGTIAVLLGWASSSPYTLVGGARVAVAEIAMDLPFVLALIGPAIVVGSLSISVVSGGIGEAVVDCPMLLVALVPMFCVALIGMVGVLERIPFDAGHAETEIVGGWETELSGRSLAIVSLSHWIFHFAASGLVASIFLGGTNFPGLDEIGTDWIAASLGFVVMIAKTLFVLFFVSLSRATFSRVRIDQLAKTMWMYVLPFVLLCNTVLFAILVYV